MLGNKMDFSCCAIWTSFHKSSHIYIYVIAECFSMRYIILRGRRVPTVEYALCIYIYLFIYLFIDLSGSTVQL